MDNGKSKEKMEIEGLFDRMNRIIEWIKTCDNKATILLSITTIVTSVLFTSDFVINGLKDILSSVEERKDNNLSLSGLFAVIFFFLTLFYTIKSLMKSLNVIEGKIDENQTQNKNGNSVESKPMENSLIHFNHISKLKYLDFKKEIEDKNYNEKDDIESQIYINAVRCKEKFDFYNESLIYLKKAFIFMLLFILFLLLFESKIYLFLCNQ